MRAQTSDLQRLGAKPLKRVIQPVTGQRDAPGNGSWSAPQLLQYRTEIDERSAAVVEGPVNFPESLDADRADHIENAVEAERRNLGHRSLEGKTISRRAVSELQTMNVLEKPPIGPTNRHIFRMTAVEPRIEASLEKLATPQREAAVANVVTIRKLRPPRTYIIIVKEAGIPSRRVEHKAVPLNDKTVLSPDMPSETSK